MPEEKDSDRCGHFSGSHVWDVGNEASMRASRFLAVDTLVADGIPLSCRSIGPDEANGTIRQEQALRELDKQKKK